MTTMLNSYQRYFRDLFPILRDMSARGIPIDNPRRLELKSLIEREDLRVTAAIQALVPSEILSTKQKNGFKNPPILACEDCDYKGRGDHQCVTSAESTGEGSMRSYTELAELHNLVLREVVIGEAEKCRCSKTKRGECAVCAGAGIIPVGLVEIRWASPLAFNPNSPPQVKRFMRYLKHPVPKSMKKVDEQGEAAETTEMKELERLWHKTKHPIYPLLIEKRQLTKVEGTYVEGWTPSKDGCVHMTYTFQTATWQTSSRAPNVQNGLKHGKVLFRKSLACAFNRMQRAKIGIGSLSTSTSNPSTPSLPPTILMSPNTRDWRGLISTHSSRVITCTGPRGRDCGSAMIRT